MPGVEPLAGEAEFLAGLHVGGVFAVGGVAQNGVADAGHVEADLVGASGFNLHFQETAPTPGVIHFKSGHGVTSLGMNGHLLAVLGAALHGCVDASGFRAGRTFDEGEVGFAYVAIQEKFGKLGEAGGSFSDHQGAGGVFVQAMHDSGAQVFAGLEFEVRQHGVGHGVVLVTGGIWVHHHAGRFVDHQHVFVFVNDVEGDVAGLQMNGCDFGRGTGHHVVFFQSISLLCGIVVDLHLALIEEFFQQTA